MVTEADREAAKARAISKIRDLVTDLETWEPEELAPLRATPQWKLLADLVNTPSHRTASTAALTAEVERLNRVVLFAMQKEPALTAEIQRLREKAALADTLDSYAGHSLGCAIYQTSWAMGAPDCSCGLDRARLKLFALSTPSEVTSPNPDEVAGTYSAFEVSEPVAETGAAWASPSLGRAYAEVERVREALAQPVESGIDEALRAALDAIEAADCELMGVASWPMNN